MLLEIAVENNKVLIDIQDGIATVKINNLAKKNALDNDVISGLVSHLSALDKNPSVEVILLGGEGEVFCAGGDVKAMKTKTEMFSGDSIELQKNYEWGIQEIPRTIERINTPIIAVVNGGAVGAGVDLACMCDMRIGSEDSFFSESFAFLALVPGDGGTFFLPRVVGYSKAMEMFLTGDKYNATSALEMGLLNKVVSKETLWDEATVLAKKIKRNSYQALRLTKKSMKIAYATSNLETVLDGLSAYQGITQDSKDHFQRLGIKN